MLLELHMINIIFSNRRFIYGLEGEIQFVIHLTLSAFMFIRTNNYIIALEFYIRFSRCGAILISILLTAFILGIIYIKLK